MIYLINIIPHLKLQEALHELVRDALNIEEKELVKPGALRALNHPGLLVLLVVLMLQFNPTHGVQVTPHQLPGLDYAYSDLKCK